MRNPWLVFLALLIELAVAQSSACEADEAGDCGHIDTEVAFAQGLGAFPGEGPGQASDLEQAATYFARAVHCDAEYGNALYWLGVTHLRQGKPRDAVIEISRSLDAKEPPRADLWRILAHLGAAQLETGDERAAGRSLEQAYKSLGKLPRGWGEEDWNDNDIVALYLLGSALERLGRHQESDELIAWARRLKPDVGDIGATVALPRYRGPFWSPRSPWRWEGSLGVSAGGDSNPNLLDDDLALSTLDDELVEGAESDEFQALDVRLAFFRLDQGDGDGEERNGWNLGMSLGGHQSLHQEFDYLDLGQGHAVIHLAWGQDPLSYVSGPLGYTRVPYGVSRLSVLLQAGYLHTWLDGETYFQGAGTALSLTVREARFTDTQVELSYQELDFEKPPFENRDRSGRLRSIDVSQLFYLKHRNRYVRLGLMVGERDADRAHARSFVEPYVETTLPFKSRWSLLWIGSLRNEDFDHSESNVFLPTAGTKPREDTTLRATVRLLWSIRPELKLLASLSYVDRDARLELPPGVSGLDYERTRFSLGLRWFFGSGG